MALMLEEIGAYLQERGHGTVNSSIFYAEWPDAPGPDEAICLHEAPGPKSRHTMGKGTGAAIRMFGIQIEIRSATNDGARTKAYAISEELEKVCDQTLSGRRYLRIEPQQEPFEADPDENERAVMRLNLIAWREP